MNLNLKNKIVLITGAAGLEGSIGYAIFQNLAKEGAIPAILDISERGQKYIDDLKSSGTDGIFIKTDVTYPEAVESAVNQVIEKYGRIDVVINNVGVNDGVGIDGCYEDFMQSLKINLVSYWLTVKYALAELKKSEGCILNIGSKVGLTGQGGTSAYAAAKGGILALTREWAVDLIRYKIRVNCIVISESWTPSYQEWINSIEDGEEKLQAIVSKIPLGNRMTTPQEIANTALFLISDNSSHTTGQHLFVDGGYVHLDRSLLTS